MEKINSIFNELAHIKHIENVELKNFSTFKCGGKARIIFFPVNFLEIKSILKNLKKNGIQYFILGGGSNTLFSDNFFSMPIISLKFISRIIIENSTLIAQAGCTMEQLCKTALKKGLSGLENFYGLPGTVGGATRMNARCYEKQISDISTSITYIDEEFNVNFLDVDNKKFSYKQTPFMNSKNIILATTFQLEAGEKENINSNMQKYMGDRITKGHFNFPSGGSTFKNNRDFGAPSGAIIDRAGLKGKKIGGAKVADYHANFIINENNATSMEIRELILTVQKEVKDKFGFLLEPEIEFVGDWSI